MRDEQKNITRFLLITASTFLVIYSTLVITNVVQKGLIENDIIKTFLTCFANPKSLSFSKLQIVIAIMAGSLFLMVAIFMTSSKNNRVGKEYGSAEWINAKFLATKYISKVKKNSKESIVKTNRLLHKTTHDHNENKILSQYGRLGLNTRKHHLNLNVLVVGGSGSGKTRFMVKPNLMQRNTSFIVTDPKQEVKNSTINMFRKANYNIIVLNLIEPRASFHYNPFHYLENDVDVLSMIDNLFSNTDGKKDNQTDNDFWSKAESALMQALIFYVWYFYPKNQQNFSSVIELLRLGSEESEQSKNKSKLDNVFYTLKENPETQNHICVKQYDIFDVSEDKTRSSILISAGVRLAPFNIPEIQQLTAFDDLNIELIGKEKSICYICIPDNDKTFNFIISMFYTQAFNVLFRSADNSNGQRLQNHVHCVMDEFANLCLPNNFDQLLATMRSREISVSIIIQALSQLKSIYKESWEKIVGNCDTMVYLGGNEQFTHEFLSKAIGKETITVKNTSQTKSTHGSSSQSIQHISRELMTPDEVRRLPNDECLLMLRGNHPTKDKKFDLTKHIAYKLLVEDYKPRHSIKIRNNDLQIDTLTKERFTMITELQNK